MTMEKIELKSSMWQLVGLVAVYSFYNIGKFIYLLVIGSTAQVAISGDVAVPTLINNTINDSITAIPTRFAQLDTAVTLVFGLIGLVVIIKLFWPMIKGIGGKTGGKGSF